MLVSVIVPTKDRPLAIADAVRSIFAGTYQHFEIFVIDQSAGNETYEALAPWRADGRLHYLTNRRPGYGAASSRNIGIALSNGEVLAIVDDDVEVRPDWMERIVAEYTTDPALDFVSGTLKAPPFDPSQGFTPAFRPDPKVTAWNLVWMVSGANISARRRLFDRIGGYDEFCGPGSRLRASDDGDITLRVVRSGAKWKACPEIEVVHTHGYRPGPAGDELWLRYSHGNGGLFGRALRRGEIYYGLRFLLHEAIQVARGLVRAVLGRKSALNHTRARLTGYVRGFRLPPNEGFVSGDALRQMRTLLEGGNYQPDALHTVHSIGQIDQHAH
jgi:glycosyltransferase involved in cell wall biosynthesis